MTRRVSPHGVEMCGVFAYCTPGGVLKYYYPVGRSTVSTHTRERTQPTCRQAITPSLDVRLGTASPKGFSGGIYCGMLRTPFAPCSFDLHAQRTIGAAPFLFGTLLPLCLARRVLMMRRSWGIPKEYPMERVVSYGTSR